jgi:glycogen operon protein
VGRTQQGNNNAYCQDNELAWMDWDALDEDMLAFTMLLVQLRRRHPIFRRKRFFAGKPINSWSDVPDIMWLRPDGGLMTDADWQVGYAKTLSIVLNGDELDEEDEFGRPLVDTSFALLCNASEETTACVIPGVRRHVNWSVVFDTAQWPTTGPAQRIAGGSRQLLAPRSMQLLQAVREPGGAADRVG